MVTQLWWWHNACQSFTLNKTLFWLFFFLISISIMANYTLKIMRVSKNWILKLFSYPYNHKPSSLAFWTMSSKSNHMFCNHHSTSHWRWWKPQHCQQYRVSSPKHYPELELSCESRCWSYSWNSCLQWHQRRCLKKRIKYRPYETYKIQTICNHLKLWIITLFFNLILGTPFMLLTHSLWECPRWIWPKMAKEYFMF